MSDSVPTIKCVLVGDDKVGKTSLIHTLASGKRPSPSNNKLDHMEKIVTTTVHHLNRAYHLWLFDTIGCPNMLKSRLTAYAAYRDPDVFLLCGDLTEPATWQHLETIWQPELVEHYPQVPLVVTGTKCEARDSIQQSAVGHGETVSTERGRRTALKLGATAYRECSTVTGHGVATVFNDVIEATVHPEKRIASRPLSVRDLWDKFVAR